MTSNRFLLTSSKFKQYSLCSRSVKESPDDLQRGGISLSGTSAAQMGSKLHLCLEEYIKEYALNRDVNDAMIAGLEKSKELNCYSEYTTEVDFNGIEYFINEITSGMSTPKFSTEVSMSMHGELGRFWSKTTTYEEAAADPKTMYAGTADVIVRCPITGLMAVWDWKTGLDEVDPAWKNLQLLSLASMVGGMNPGAEIRVGICQTRKPMKHTISLYNNVGRPVFIDYSGSNYESSGDHCRYCKLKGDCVSFAKMAESEAIIGGFGAQDSEREDDP